MVDRTANPRELTIGLDLGDRFSWGCVLDAKGQVLETFRVATTPEACRRQFEAMPRSLVALEVGTHSPWVSRVLAECGHDVVVANPRRLRMIYASDDKCDEIDAESLARVARVDPKLLAPVQHRGVQAQADLEVIRARDALVRARTQQVQHIRGAVKAFGHRVKKCTTPAFAKRAAQLPQALRRSLEPTLETLQTLNTQIRAYDRQIEAMAERYPETRLLRQVTGVGPLTATTFVLTIEDPTRFSRSRDVGSYFGLRPRRAQSGARDPQLRITKAGDPMTRRLLVGCAQYILGPFGPDSDLRRHGLALAERGGKAAKKRAIVAVARKLAVLLHHLWITGEAYEPLHNAEARGQVA